LFPAAVATATCFSSGNETAIGRKQLHRSLYLATKFSQKECRQIKIGMVIAFINLVDVFDISGERPRSSEMSLLNQSIA